MLVEPLPYTRQTLPHQEIQHTRMKQRPVLASPDEMLRQCFDTSRWHPRRLYVVVHAGTEHWEICVLPVTRTSRVQLLLEHVLFIFEAGGGIV